MVDKHVVGKETQSAGKAFEQRLKNSWCHVPGAWHLRIVDAGSERPADAVLLLKELRILYECKRISSERFSISGNLKPHQIKACADFSELHENNIGVIFINFYQCYGTLDRTFAVSILRLLKFMYAEKKKGISIDELEAIHAVELKRNDAVSWEYLYNLSTFEQDIKPWKW